MLDGFFVEGGSRSGERSARRAEQNVRARPDGPSHNLLWRCSPVNLAII